MPTRSVRRDALRQLFGELFGQLFEQLFGALGRLLATGELRAGLVFPNGLPNSLRTVARTV